MEVCDLILNTPADTPYTVLKRELIRRTAGSNQQKLQRMFNEVELGDQKPPHAPALARREALLRELFLQRLPSNVRMILAPSGATISLNDPAEMADHIRDVPTPGIVGVRGPLPTTSTEFDALRSEVRQLQELVKTLTVHSKSTRHRSPTPARRRSARPSDHTRCWYHQRFGTKCRPPCRQGNDQASR